MKRTLVIVLAFLLTALYGKTITSDSFGSYVIVIPDAASKLVFPEDAEVSYAAYFLNGYFEKSTGRKLPVKKEKDSGRYKKRIFVGPTAFAEKHAGDLSKLSPEELVIMPVGEDLILCGEVTKEKIDRGTLFAVYEFLERSLGVRWFFPDDPKWAFGASGTIVPKRNEISFPDETVRQVPAFRQREGGISYDCQKPSIQIQWHPVLRFGNTLSRKNANHTQVGWTALYGKSHPEYFAKGTDGKPRINFNLPYRNYICLSSRAVKDRMLENLKAFDRGESPKDAWGSRPPEKNYVYFSCNDGMIPKTTCHCAECLKLLNFNTAYEGQGSELFFRFVAEYAKEVDKNWPGRKLVTLAYSHYLAPPEKTEIPQNLIVTYVGPKIHYANDPQLSEMHKAYLLRWEKLLNNDPDRLSIWMNIVNPTINVSYVPFMYPNIFKKWLLFTRGKVGGYFINGLNPYLKRHGEKGIVGSVQTFPMVWLQARMLWNPEADVDQLLRDYCSALFSPADREMFDFYKKVIERWENFAWDDSGLSEVDYIHTVRYPPAEVRALRELLEQAEKKAGASSEAGKRIAYLKDTVYSRFFAESEKYQRRSGMLPVYECVHTTRIPEVDGKANDPCWKDLASFSLGKRQWGEEPEYKTYVKALYNKDTLFILAELECDPKRSHAEEEFRIQSSLRPDPLKNCYAPNIDRRWLPFRELRISSEGKIKTLHGISGARAAASVSGSRITIEAAVPVASLFPGFSGTPHMTLRLQFMRYWGVWDDYDLWSPTLSNISDYPTWRFGIFQMIPPLRTEKDGLE